MSSDIYTTPYTIYSATPGAGDWLIDCRLSGLAAGANTFTWKATVAGVTVNGAGEDATKDTAETTMQAVIPVHAAAGEAVVVTVQSDSSSDTAVTATASATFAATDMRQILGTALTETSAGYLAAAFKKLFDVATPLLVASSPMRGTDGAYTGTPPTAAAIADAALDEAKGDHAGFITTLALEATLTAIKGAGWSTETLKAIKAVLDAAATATNLAAVDTVVDAIKVKTDLLGTGVVAVQSGVSTDGKLLTLTRGDAYLIESGTAIRLTLAAGAVRDLTGAAAVRCTVRSKATDAVLIDDASVTVVSSGIGEQLLDLEFASAETAVLPVGRASYFDVEADFGDDDYTTVTSGVVLVRRDETRH